MTKDVFSFNDYKAYLHASIEAKPGHGRGMKSAMAKALDCQTSYISQVLNENAHLSLEQGDKLNSFLSHNSEESNFFLLQIQLARSGTPSLKKHWQKEMSAMLEKRLVLRERLDFKRILSREDQTIYYSSWMYSAIHVMLTIPKFRDKRVIAEHLGVSLSTVTEVLDFLVSIGLAAVSPDGYTTTESYISIGSDSPLVSRHHINWRMQAMRATEKERGSDNLHYSSAWSISAEDFAKVKAQLVKCLEDVRGNLKNSKEEELVCLNMDFFKI